MESRQTRQSTNCTGSQNLIFFYFDIYFFHFHLIPIWCRDVIYLLKTVLINLKFIKFENLRRVFFFQANVYSNTYFYTHSFNKHNIIKRITASFHRYQKTPPPTQLIDLKKIPIFYPTQKKKNSKISVTFMTTTDSLTSIKGFLKIIISLILFIHFFLSNLIKNPGQTFLTQT